MMHSLISGDAVSVPQITATVCEPNGRLLSLLLASRPITTAEWAEIEASAEPERTEDF